MANDKRQAPRVDVNIPVRVEGVSATWEAMIKNFSIHGLCYAVPAGLSAPPADKEVFLRFSLLERISPIQVMGWVVHTEVKDNCSETGVTFMFLEPKDEELLQDFVQRKSAKPEGR